MGISWQDFAKANSCPLPVRAAEAGDQEFVYMAASENLLALFGGKAHHTWIVRLSRGPLILDSISR